MSLLHRRRCTTPYSKQKRSSFPRRSLRCVSLKCILKRAMLSNVNSDTPRHRRSHLPRCPLPPPCPGSLYDLRLARLMYGMLYQVPPAAGYTQVATRSALRTNTWENKYHCNKPLQSSVHSSGHACRHSAAAVHGRQHRYGTEYGLRPCSHATEKVVFLRRSGGDYNHRLTRVRSLCFLFPSSLERGTGGAYARSPRMRRAS